MADNLQFVLELVDKMSGTADKMSKALEKVQTRTHAAGKESDDFFGRVSAANKRVADEFLEGFAEKFAVFEMAKGAAEIVGELAEKVLDLGVEFAKSSLEAGLFEQKSAIAFEKLSGSAEQGKAVMEEAKGFANQFAISYAESAELFKTGLLKGLDFTGPNSITKFAQVGVDLEKMGLGSAKSIVAAFGDVQEKGQLTARSLMAFKETGINFEMLGQKLGFASSKMGKGGAFDNLTEGLTKHAIPASKALPAILDVLGSKFGVIGGSAEKMGNLVDGQIQKLKNAWEDLLGRVAESGALDKVATIIGKIADSMTGAAGARWADLFDRLFESVSKFLEPLSTDEGMKSFTNGLYEFAHAVSQVLNVVEKALPPIAKLVGFWAEGVGDTLLGAKSIFDKVADIPSSFSRPAAPKGPDINTMSWDDAAAAGLLPAHGSGGHFDTPHVAVVGDEPETIIPDSVAGAMTRVHAPISQVINVHGVSGVDLEQLARMLHRLGLGELQGALDTLAQQMGVG
jgi:hypothetical protein